jgi:hypothetical protein
MLRLSVASRAVSVRSQTYLGVDEEHEEWTIDRLFSTVSIKRTLCAQLRNFFFFLNAWFLLTGSLALLVQNSFAVPWSHVWNPSTQKKKKFRHSWGDFYKLFASFSLIGDHYRFHYSRSRILFWTIQPPVLSTLSKRSFTTSLPIMVSIVSLLIFIHSPSGMLFLLVGLSISGESIPLRPQKQSKGREYRVYQWRECTLWLFSNYETFALYSLTIVPCSGQSSLTQSPLCWFSICIWTNVIFSFYHALIAP